MGIYVKEENQPWNHKQIAGNAIGDNALDATSNNNIKNKVVAGKLGNTDISDIGDGTVTGAVSKLNSDLTRFSQITTITYKGVGLYISKLGNIVTISLNGTTNAKISANEHILNLEGAYSNNSVGQDIRIPSGQRFILHYNHYICFGEEIASGAIIRGSVIYACPNFTPLT